MKASFPVTGIDLGYFIVKAHEMVERYEWAKENGLKVSLAGDILYDDIILEGSECGIKKWIELFFDIDESVDNILKQYIIDE